MAYQLRQSGTFMSQGEHAAHVVVNCSCKDTTQYDPQISSRSVLSAHNGTEDGTGTGYVKELNHEDLPIGQYDKVHAVGFRNGRCNPVIGSEYFFDKTSIDKIAYDEGYQ